MKDFIKDIPGWAKGVVVIIVIALLAYIGYKFYKNFKPRTDEEKDLDKDKNALINKGQKPTYPRSWYNTSADKIYSCGAGQRMRGTDESCIYAVFVSLNNDLDLILLTEAFGERRKGFGFADANLGGWLADQLNGEELKALNNILARRKINFRY